jgi:hypothetical protein
MIIRKPLIFTLKPNAAHFETVVAQALLKRIVWRLEYDFCFI